MSNHTSGGAKSLAAEAHNIVSAMTVKPFYFAVIYPGSSCLQASSSTDVQDGVLSLSSLWPPQLYVATLFPHGARAGVGNRLLSFAPNEDGTAQLNVTS